MNLRRLIWDLDSLTCKLCLHNKVGQGTAFKIPTLLFYSSIFLHICRFLYILGSFLPSLALLTNMTCQYFQFFWLPKKIFFQTGTLSTSQTLFIIISQISSSSYRPGDLVENWGSNWVLAGACFLSFLPMIGPAPPLPLLLPTYSFVLPPLLTPPAATNPPSYFHPCPSFSHSIQVHSYHPVSPPSDAFNCNSPLLFHLHLFH